MPDPGGLSLFRMFEAWDDVPDFYRGAPLTAGMFPPPSSDAAATCPIILNPKPKQKKINIGYRFRSCDLS